MLQCGEKVAVLQAAVGKRGRSARPTAAALIASGIVLTSAPAFADEWIYVLRQGENPWTIAQRHLRSMAYWQPLVALNRIADPTAMPPGSRLRIPLDWLRTAAAPVELEASAGTVSVIPTGSSAPQPLFVGRSIALGETVVTGPDGSATVRLADDSRLQIGPDSRVVFDQVRRLGDGTMIDSRVSLEQGEIRAAILRRAPGRARHEIWTQPGVAAVRGTVHRARVTDDQQRLTSEVLEGDVAVSGDGRTRQVRAGFATRVAAGEAPEPPAPLLPPPVLTGPARLERLPLRFAVDPGPAAAAMRVEIARTPAFAPLLGSLLTQGAEVRLPDLPDGAYALRLRAVDARGIEGRDLQVEVVVEARPEPPAPLAPAREGRVREPQALLRWAAIEGAAGYRVQVAAEASFAAPLLDAELEAVDSLVTPTTLPEGTYWWRIATRSSDGETGPFSDPQPFRRKDPPPAADRSEIATGDGPPVLRWRDAGPGITYRVEIATDRGFTDIVLAETVAEPALALKGLQPGPHFLRIQLLEPGEEPGPFGPTQRIEVPPWRWWPLALVPWGALLLLLAL